MKNNFSSSIVQREQLLPGIHGLRGVAALAVVLFHLHHLVNIAPPVFFHFIGKYFGYSVHLFFILSAFSLSHSLSTKGFYPNWIIAYLLKRFFRIAPLFYFIAIIELCRQLINTGNISTPINQIILNFSFAFGLVPFQGIVWGGWSVGVEMIFYLLFPILALSIKTHRNALTILLISIVISYVIRGELHAQHIMNTPKSRWDWSYFAFGSNICFFIMGIYAYKLTSFFKSASNIYKYFFPLATVLILLIIFKSGQYSLKYVGINILIWGLGLMMICIWQGTWPSSFIANSIFEFFGERSFSIYLLHPVIIHYSKNIIASIYNFFFPTIGSISFFLCFIILLCFILPAAELTYRLIEIPGINLGKKIINTQIKHSTCP